MEKLGGRKLKRRLEELLRRPDFHPAVEAVLKIPARQAVNPLFSFFYSGDETLKWRAVSAMGAVTASLARENIESARVIMRRLMWNLNDESGGIGWGSPEALGEIMARHRGLAREFAGILASYTDEEGNYLEHEVLQRGVLWGLGRLAHARPALGAAAAEFLPPYLFSPDPALRGLCAWVAGAIPCKAARSRLERLCADTSPLTIWMEDRLVGHTVGQLARAALSSTDG